MADFRELLVGWLMVDGFWFGVREKDTQNGQNGAGGVHLYLVRNRAKKKRLVHVWQVLGTTLGGVGTASAVTMG